MSHLRPAAVDATLLLVGHGTIEPQGVAEFLEVARLLGERIGHERVSACFLELARPDIAEGFQALVQRGARRVVFVPLTLFAGGHAKRDIPLTAASLAANHPTISVSLGEHLGCHPSLVELSQLRYEQALLANASLASQTTLVLVGRGSRDGETTAEMLEFVACRRQLGGPARVREAFVALTEPSLESVLTELADAAAPCVVVQPHLLFAGVLADRIANTVRAFAQRYPKTVWLTAAHLGPAEQVVYAAVDRAGML